MPKQFLQLEDHLAMLNEYAPHKVKLIMPHQNYSWLVLVGVDFSAGKMLAALDMGRVTNRLDVTEAQLQLYSLADLPNLPGGDGGDYASPMASIIHALNFIQRGDYGSGEWVREVKVTSASDARLHLAFSTSLSYEPGSYDEEDDDFCMNPENFVGADYEVIIDTTGTVHYRCVTADQLQGERVHHWRAVNGVHVFEAFTMLRRLHVAVGMAAYVHHTYNGKDYDKHYSYVRKELPAVEQEGGQADA